MTDSQLGQLEDRINAILGAMTASGPTEDLDMVNGNPDMVQAQFDFTGKADYTLNISQSGIAAWCCYGWSGWPFFSPTIYWGTMNNNPVFAGTAATHELMHRMVGPVFDLWGSYNGTPNLMDVNQAGKPYSSDVRDDWSNQNAVVGFASLSAAQVEKLYKKCTQKHGSTPDMTNANNAFYEMLLLMGNPTYEDDDPPPTQHEEQVN